MTCESEEINTSNPASPLPPISCPPWLWTVDIKAIRRSTTKSAEGSSCGTGVWSTGVVEYLRLGPSISNSTIPILLEQSFLLKFSDHAIIYDVFDPELADGLAGFSEQTNHVPQTLRVGINFPVVKRAHHLVTGLGILDFGQAQLSGKRFDHSRFVARVVDVSDRLDHRAQSALGNFRCAVDEAALGDHAEPLIGNAHFHQVAEHAVALAFQLCAVSIAEIAAVDDVLRDRLRQHGLIADDAKLNVVALGIEAPVLEGEHGKHPNSAADALHADSLAFQIRRRFDARVDHKRAVELVDQTGDISQIQTARHGAERRAGRRADMKLGLASRECRHADLGIANVYNGRIDAVLLKNSRIAGNPENAAAFVQAAESINDFVGRRCRARCER